MEAGGGSGEDLAGASPERLRRQLQEETRLKSVGVPATLTRRSGRHRDRGFSFKRPRCPFTMLLSPLFRKTFKRLAF